MLKSAIKCNGLIPGAQHSKCLVVLEGREPVEPAFREYLLQETMNMTDPISLSFHEILSLYHQFGFERRLNPKANKIAIGILTKWDRLLHPDSFIMGNIELAEIAGLDHNKVNISRNRSLVIKRCTVNAVPLFGYISNGQKQPGTYIVNIQAFTYDYKEKVIIPTSQKPIPPLV